MMQPQPFFPNAKGSASGRLGEARLQTAPVSSAAMALPGPSAAPPSYKSLFPPLPSHRMGYMATYPYA
ncbi:hypothetical protein N7466_008131 [Penicillium verhagenii]|uniref:uncharacterized protein n=1 Tax=Penicillium verhagenii TaxID=1562060 RepID=UPI00254572F9|nr:uncharacterized protein N7466_008131 [Penicillium verhagenii]KAJ5923944.1 hypothetical protein N7466_008131 [Penicillium verhagenii]